MQSYHQQQDSICVQALATLKTRAKDDQGKTYWIYPNDEVLDDFERKHILEIRPSVTLAKNVKRKVLVFALLNCEVIKAMYLLIVLLFTRFILIVYLIINMGAIF